MGHFAPRLGFEPRTLKLTASCSTIELSRNEVLFYHSSNSSSRTSCIIPFMPSEATIINSIKKLFSTNDPSIILGIGDDAAVIQPHPAKKLVFTCDAQVEGTHFLTSQITPKQLGFRAMIAGALASCLTACIAGLLI